MAKINYFDADEKYFEPSVLWDYVVTWNTVFDNLPLLRLEYNVTVVSKNQP